MLPEDYRHEEIKNLKLHGITALHFNEGLQSTDFTLTQLEGSMKIHPLRFEQFSGKMHLEKGHMSVKQFKGKMGHSNFIADLEYTLDPKKSSLPNSLTVKGSHLDIDELLNYNPPPTTASANTDAWEESPVGRYGPDCSTLPQQAQALLQRSLPQAASLPANDGVRVKLQLAQARVAGQAGIEHLPLRGRGVVQVVGIGGWG